jgi:dTDP-3,4-didehydro-2,6-dideoxy-alpha-D-glucose 3-reductase
MKNIVIWGLGNHALVNIIPAVLQQKKLNLYGICTRNKALLQKNQKLHNCLGWNDDLEMLKDKNIDIVYLSTPIGLHANQGVKVLNAGKHFWCEKPMSSNYLDTKKLINLSRERNLSIAEGFMYFHHPQFLRLKELLKMKILGEIMSANIRFGIPFLDKPGFRLNPELSGGAFWDVGCYPISAALSLFPNQNYEVISSKIISQKGYQVDTRGGAKILFNNTTEVNLDWAIGSSYRNEIDIWGEKNSIYTDKIFSKKNDYEPILNYRDNNGNLTIEKIQSSDHFSLMLEVFIKLLSDKSFQDIERDNILRRAIAANTIYNRDKSNIN